VSLRTQPRHRRKVDAFGGVAGNERLTAMTGAVLLVGFAAEGVTILRLHSLLTVHFILGMALIGPVMLKACSTSYRFFRYYTGSAPYLSKGPPLPVLRVLGPLVLVTSLAVIGTGVMLAIVGPGSGPWPFLHKASFVLWFCCMTVHVVWYAPKLPRILLGSGERVRSVVTGAGRRWLALTAALAAGVVIAVLTVHTAHAWQPGIIVKPMPGAARH
jgi:hypothetical protein